MEFLYTGPRSLFNRLHLSSARGAPDPGPNHNPPDPRAKPLSSGFTNVAGVRRPLSERGPELVTSAASFAARAVNDTFEWFGNLGVFSGKSCARR